MLQTIEFLSLLMTCSANLIFFTPYVVPLKSLACNAIHVLIKNCKLTYMTHKVFPQQTTIHEISNFYSFSQTSNFATRIQGRTGGKFQHDTTKILFCQAYLGVISKKIITKFFGSHATVKTENSLVQSHKKVTIQICIKNANYLQPFRQIFNSLKINIKMRSSVFFSPVSTQCKRNCVNISQKFIHTDSKYFCHCHTNNKHEKLIQSADLKKKFS